MKLFVCMLLVTIVVMATLIDDSEGGRRRRRSSGQQADTDATQCPTLTSPENGALSPEGANSYDDVVTFTCNQGYELEGASTIQCPTLTPPENGALSPEGANSYDDVVTFTCNQGYELGGASSVRCRADQIWSDSVPTCTPIQCPTLTPPENGALSPEGANSYDDVVTFTCNQGYELEGASRVRCRADRTWSDPVPTCTQDQCATDNGGCAHNCTNVPGSYTCSCRQGFALMTDNHGCEDTDECASSNGGCEQTCTNTPGGFLCSCQHGYTLNRDGLACDDVNECEVSPGICGREAECVNLNGTFDCKCSPGFSMAAGCEDVDECSGEHACHENAFCVNQPGSYYCVCLDGFTGNGTTCTEVVPTTTPTSPTTTVKSTTVTTLAGYTTPLTSTTVSTESSAAPSTTSTSLKATTTKGDAIDSDLEETTTSPLSTPIVTFVSHEPPEASKTSLLQTRTINTIADLQYDKDDPGSILDQLIPYKAQFDKVSSSKDRKVDSTTCTDAMTALARLSRASAAEDSTETMATITRDVIALCGTLPLDAQAEGGYVVGAMADSIKRGALGGASMEELAPKAAAVVDTVSSLMESAGSETVSEDEEDVAALGKLPPRKREEFRQKMKEKLREKQERQWAYQREVTRELQRNLDSIADALLDSKGGGERVELGSKAVQMVLEMTSGGRLGGAAVSAHAGGVTFPGPHALNEGGVAKDADMKARVVGYDRNPYVWDESARDIKSSVVDIELRRPGGGTLKVKDLSEDITVVLKNAPDMFPAPRLVKYSPFPNDTMVFRTFSARRNQTYGVLVSLVAPYPGAVMYGKLGDFPNETDYDFKKEFSWDDFIAKTVPPHGDVHVTYTVLQPDTAVDNGTEEYTIGLRVDGKWHHGLSECCNYKEASFRYPCLPGFFTAMPVVFRFPIRPGCPPEGCPYSVDITRLDCVFWDPGIDAELGSWKRDGCRVSPASTLAHTVCLCDHLTGFGTSGGTEPNRINFKTVFSKFKDLVNNYAVWTTMVVVMGMYFVMIYPARRKDKADEQKWSIKNVHGNRRRHRSRFLVRVDTGHDWGAGTRSKVVFVLTGDKGSTGPRSFQQDDMTFQTGGVNTFLLTTPQKLGGLTSLTVWHDNSGEGRHASWFLERVKVTDLRTNKKTQFVCNDWLGVEHGDGCLKRTLPPTAETDVSLGQRFSLKLREKFKDGHVWLSVVTSRPKSYFSRVQGGRAGGIQRRAHHRISRVDCGDAVGEPLDHSSGVPRQLDHRADFPPMPPKGRAEVFRPAAALLVHVRGLDAAGPDHPGLWVLPAAVQYGVGQGQVHPVAHSVRTVVPTVHGGGPTSRETLPAEPLAAWSELQETEQLKQQRAERKNWLQLTNNGKQCILGIIIITAAILMVHEVWSPSAPAINQRLKAGFSNGTNLVKTQRDVLPWLEGAFARKLYPTHQYNGDALDWRDSVFINDMPAYRVGPVRLGQIRARTGKCDVPQPALHSNKTCVMTYVSGIAGEAAASFPESTPTTFSHVVHGTIGSYGGPGYRVNLGEMQAEMMETLRILEANRWIDQYTTALVLDLTLYHVNANLFSTVSVLFEFPSSAGAIATLKVSTFPLTAQGMAPTIIFVAKAVFVACLLYVTIRLVKNARKEGRSFILQVWTVVEVASVVASLYVIWAMASKDAFVGKAKTLISQELQKEQRSFVDLSDVAFWTVQFTAALAMVIWLNLVKICSLLRVSARVRTYLDTLINIRMQLLGSLAIFILTVTGFSISGYLLFCPYVETFRSLSAATIGLTFLPWGEISYAVLATPSELVGPLFLFASGFTIMYMMLSFTAGVFVSATSAMMGEKGRGKIAAAQQRKNRRAKAAREARAAAPPARNTLHYCNCDEGNECFGQTHTAETQV
ncbi:uncharacterized protein LOC144908390 [Branchiostoma floridae x Branchiostoma belcheri]